MTSYLGAVVIARELECGSPAWPWNPAIPEIFLWMDVERAKGIEPSS
jgi:hypothetical protein